MKISRKSSSGPARRARLEVYLAAGVGAIGAGTSAEAGIIALDLTGRTGDNMGVPANGFAAFPNIIPGAEIHVRNGYNGFRGIGVQLGQGALLGTTLNPPGLPIKLAPGDFINSSSSVFTASYQVPMFRTNGRTVPDFGPNSYLGFRTGSGQYGYLEVLWNSSTNTFRLVSGAYESTVGAAIQIPNSAAAVPEPASTAVAALIMGGTALRQWRKKRRDQVATTDDCLAS